MKKPYAPLTTYVAPAVPRAELWRLGAGVALIVALALLMATAFGALAQALLPGEGYARYSVATSQGPGEVLFILFGFGFFLIATFVCADLLHDRRPATLLGHPTLALLQGARVMTAVLLLSVVLWLLPPWDMSDLRPGLGFGTWAMLLPVSLLAVAIQVTAEEVIFRGYLLQQLAARFSHPAVWMVGPSILFGLLHHDPDLGGNTIWLMLSATLFGLAAADLTARSGTLAPAIALHFVNNASAFLLISAQEDLGALALYLIEVDLTDPAQIRMLSAIDAGVLLCSWLAARVALRR